MVDAEWLRGGEIGGGERLIGGSESESEIPEGEVGRSCACAGR